VFKRIIHIKAAQCEGRTRHFSIDVCISLGVDVRLPTETLNFQFQKVALLNLISLQEGSVTFLVYLTNGCFMRFQRRHKRITASSKAAWPTPVPRFDLPES
jgi:hypothetical protein